MMMMTVTRLLQRPSRSALNVCHSEFIRHASDNTNIAKCQLLIVGGGSGGLGAAALLGSRFNTTVVEPADFHYYQPFFTLVGCGLKQLEECSQPMKKVMPSNVKWIQEGAGSFDPANNLIMTDRGTTIKYDILIVATGIHPDFSKIPGLVEALKTPHVGSNYTPETVTKTLISLQNFEQGNAIFTFPSTPIKCPGAPQKIAYLTDEYLQKKGKRNKAKIIYTSAGGVLFGVKKYADSLWKVVNERQINVHLQHNLVEVNSERKEVIFENTSNDKKVRVSMDYEMLHVTPPMFPLAAVANSPLADSVGFVDINKSTLQHSKYENVFAIGDCTAHLPKTAAAVAASLGVLEDNVTAFSVGKPLKTHYNGYTSCPLTTGFNRCILAEFNNFTLEPMETFPFDQGKERRSMYYLKRDVIPMIYWKLQLKGRWTGPSTLRRLMRLGSS